MFDMAGDIEFPALICRTPIEQERASADVRDRRGEGNFRIEIENPWRVDQRRHKQDRWSAATVITDARTANTRSLWLGRRCGIASRALVILEPR